MTKPETIDVLLERWEESRETGFEVSAEQLCRNCPELLPELQAQIAELNAMSWLDLPDQEAGCLPCASEIDRPFESRIGETKIPTILDGRYEMESLIAEGGFAQVWRATDNTLQRPVAIKITTVDCLTEARRVAKLKHNGIVTVHDVGNVNGLCYIVFDLVNGRTLEEYIRRGDLGWQQTVTILIQVAERVHFAHMKGFVHRDIKPANILLDEDGLPVLADFGIAVTECELRHEAMTSFGTLAYMAPEQLRTSDAIDVRTDVYGIGVVFYEMLTGRLPFQDSRLVGLREKILQGNPTSPSLIDSQIPDRCSQICLKCLSAKKEDRYPSAKDVANDLRRQFDFLATA